MQSRKIKGLLLLSAVALAARVGLVLALTTQHRAPITYEHGQIARNLVEGRGFVVRFLGMEGPTSQQAPLYPALLAVLYAKLGVESPAAIVAMQLLQCLAGSAIVLSTVWLGWSLLPERPLVGWLAGWGAALYPPHIYMVTHIQVVIWSTLVLTLLSAVVLAGRTQWPIRQGVFFGMMSGVLLLLDPILAVALPVLFLALALKHNSPSFSLSPSLRLSVSPSPTLSLSPSPPLKPAAVMMIMTLLVIAPWLWRNYRMHGEFVFIKTTFGYAFWQGNNELSWGTDKVPKPTAEQLRLEHDGTLAGVDRALWEARHETIYIDDLLLKPTRYQEFVGLSEPRRSRLLLQRAVQFIGEHPGRYLELCGQRLRYFLLFDETNPKAANPLYRLSTLFWLISASAGLVLSAGMWDQNGRRLFNRFWPTLVIFAAVLLFHTMTIVSARFRIPVEPLTFCWCALAVAEAIRLIANLWQPAVDDKRAPWRGSIAATLKELGHAANDT